MTSEQDQWKQIQVVFERAVELPSEERREYLDEICNGDDSMRREVESLLASFQPSSELEDSPLNWDPPQVSSQADSILGYQILKELHRGGQGVVYLAIQESTKRKVALKVLLEGPFAGLSSKRRFEREIELVGSLRHPGVVAIFDSGITHGQYYYAMEYIRGQRLDEFIKLHELGTRQILLVMSKVCHAVGYAHLRGVIHRDLKPANVMVDDAGEPHVLDFGLAKTGVDPGVSGLVSVNGQIMGTLAYMSPEQASGSAEHVDMRCDVYALGVVLHELLAGQLPHNLDSSMANNLVTIQQAEPRRLNRLDRRISDEVATIVSKSLSKEKSRRYPTASALGEDIDRYLKGEPIEAKRDNPLYILQKTLRRNLIPTLIATSFATVILVSSIVAWSLYWRSEAASKAFQLERDRAEQRSEELRRSLYLAEMNLAGQASNEPGGIDRVEELVRRWPFGVEQPDLHGWEWFYLRSLPNRERFVLPHDQLVWSIALSPSGHQMVSGGAGGIVKLWTLGAKPTVHQLKTTGLPTRSVDWSPNGRWIAAGATDRSVIVWDAKTHEVLHEWNHGRPVLSVAFHPDKPWLVSAGNGGGCKVWNVASGKLIQQIDHDGVINSAQWSPDGRRIVYAGRESGTIHLYELAIGPEDSVTAQRRFQLDGHSRGVFAVRWSPEGNRIASCEEGGTTIVWDASQGSSLSALWSNEWSSEIRNLTWNPSGDELLVVSEDGSARILDATTGKEKQNLLGHTSPVWGCCWSRDGHSLVTGADDRTVRVWNQQGRFRNIITHDDQLQGFTSIDWSPDGKKVLTGGNQHWVVLWDAKSGERLDEFEGHTGGLRSVKWSPDGSRFVSTSWDKTAIVWDAASGKIANQLLWHLETAKDSVAPVHCARWSPNGKYIVSCGHATSAIVWDADTLEVQARLDDVAPIVNDVIWHPAGEWLVIGGNDNKIRIWNPWTGQTREPLTAHQGRIRSVDMSPSGNQLASASADGTVIIWDFDTGNILHTLKDHVAGVLCVQWHPNGKQLATTSHDKTLRIWNAQNGFQTLTIKAHSERVDGLAWSPHGKRLATASEDGSIRIFDARLGYERSELTD